MADPVTYPAVPADLTSMKSRQYQSLREQYVASVLADSVESYKTQASKDAFIQVLRQHPGLLADAKFLREIKIIDRDYIQTAVRTIITDLATDPVFQDVARNGLHYGKPLTADGRKNLDVKAFAKKIEENVDRAFYQEAVDLVNNGNWGGFETFMADKPYIWRWGTGEGEDFKGLPYLYLEKGGDPALLDKTMDPAQQDIDNQFDFMARTIGSSRGNTIRQDIRNARKKFDDDAPTRAEAEARAQKKADSKAARGRFFGSKTFKIAAACGLLGAIAYFGLLRDGAPGNELVFGKKPDIATKAPTTDTNNLTADQTDADTVDANATDTDANADNADEDKTVDANATGTDANATDTDANATGTDANATDTDANATGTDANATGTDANATGTDADATGTDAKTGTDANAKGTDADATGTDANATGTDAKTGTDANAKGGAIDAKKAAADKVAADKAAADQALKESLAKEWKTTFETTLGTPKATLVMPGSTFGTLDKDTVAEYIYGLGKHHWGTAKSLQDGTTWTKIHSFAAADNETAAKLQEIQKAWADYVKADIDASQKDNKRTEQRWEEGNVYNDAQKDTSIAAIKEMIDDSGLLADDAVAFVTDNDLSSKIHDSGPHLTTAPVTDNKSPAVNDNSGDKAKAPASVAPSEKAANEAMSYMNNYLPEMAKLFTADDFKNVKSTFDHPDGKAVRLSTGEVVLFGKGFVEVTGGEEGKPLSEQAASILAKTHVASPKATVTGPCAAQVAEAAKAIMAKATPTPGPKAGGAHP